MRPASGAIAVDPVNNTTRPFINFLASTIDIVFRPGTNGRSQFFLLEYSANMSAAHPAPGRVLVFNTADGQVLADGIGKPYVTSRTGGTVPQISVTPAN